MTRSAGQTTSAVEAVEASVARIARRQRRVRVFTAICVTLALAMVVVLAGALLNANAWGRVLGWRMTVAGVTWGGVIGIACVLVGGALRRRTIVGVAREMERRFPAIEDRLSTVLTGDLTGGGSASLLARVAREALGRLDAIPATEVAPTGRMRKWLLAIIAAAVVWAAMLSVPVSRRVVAVGLFRVSRPWTSQLPDWLAEVSVRPGDVKLLEGEDLKVEAVAPAERVRVEVKPDGTPGVMRELRATGAARWEGVVGDVRESFRYRVVADGEMTRSFRAEVLPRPRIEALTIRYDYPTYTGLPPVTVVGLDAAIDGLQGSRVTLSVRTSRAVDPGKSRLMFQPRGRSGAEALELRMIEAGEYAAGFTLDQDGVYWLDLVDSAGTHSKAETPRRVVARADQVPSIVLNSAEEISARPDDVILLEYLAGDDFGVTRVEALLEVDGAGAKVMAIPFDAADPKHVSGPEYPMDLRGLGADPEAAHEVVYQLRVTDNRTPGPQSAVSLRHRIRIDPKQARSYQGQVDEALGKTLTFVIESAIKELERARPRLVQSRTRDGNEPLGEWQRRELHTAAHDLPELATRVMRSAAQPADTTFVPVTRTLSELAQGPLRTAAEEAARAEMVADQWRERNEAITRATGAIDEAHAALQKLLDSGQVERRRGEAEAARDLEAAGNLQREALEAMKKSETAKGAELQGRAGRRLSQSMGESALLRDDAARQLAEKLQGLARAVHELGGRRQVDAAELAALKRALGELDSTPLARRAQRAREAMEKLDRQNPKAALNAAEKALRGEGENQAGEGMSAAFSAQEASQAMRESDVPSAESVAQAAAALGQAAAGMRLALAGTGSGQAETSAPKGGGNDAAVAGGPGRGAVSGPLPASIRDLGISPEQWLKLSAAEQREVMATSVQRGPREYRPLIQDYYVKVSQMPGRAGRPSGPTTRGGESR